MSETKSRIRGFGGFLKGLYIHFFTGDGGKFSFTNAMVVTAFYLIYITVQDYRIKGSIDITWAEFVVSLLPWLLVPQPARRMLSGIGNDAGSAIGTFAGRIFGSGGGAGSGGSLEDGIPVSGKQPMGQTNKKSLVAIARTQLGVAEIPGKDSNQVILNYAKELGVDWYKNDDTAWCALFAGWVVKRAGYKPSGSLLAKSYLKWGKAATEADIPSGNVIAIFHRGKPGAPTGHVGFVTRATDKSLYILGGNQSNKVNEALFSKATLLALRKPN